MKVIGLMSGTSLDGLDICFAKFVKIGLQYSYQILYASTYEYNAEWKLKLRNAYLLKTEDLLSLNQEYGEFLGNQVNIFIKNNKISNVDLISSHGHTIFHQPKKKLTYQIGCGKSIFLTTNIKTICDFRTQDVLLGGQGAPLVPIGDEFLFHKYDACMNLGGFSNISFKNNNQRIGFDISPVNIPLNYLANQFGKEYDKNGELAKTHSINHSLLSKLNKLEYYFKTSPKSLGIEWFNSTFKPIINQYSKEECITTTTEHIAVQISRIINQYSFKNILVTGGGAKNNYLIESINNKINHPLYIPSIDLIDYKEALIFSFMGYLKANKKDNILCSVTGSNTNHCSGTIFE